jgi:predicted dehydrogenase
VKLAVVGVGYWGPNLVRNLVSVAGVEQVVVCDLSAERLARVQARIPAVVTTQDYDAVLADPSIDAVVLATPISTHAPLGTRALAAGKHLFVEKPLAHDVASARALIAAAEAADRVLMVGHTFEFSPPVERIKKILSSGDLGRIYFISSERVNLGLHQRDASVIWDLAPHDLSILFYWLDERPARITAVGRDCVQPGVPDVAFITLSFPSGVLANLEVAWLAPSKLRRTAIVGERKMLVYDDTENIEKVKVYDQGVDFQDPDSFGEYQLSYRTGDIVSPRLPSIEPLRAEMEHFVACCRTGARPRSDGLSGLRVVESLQVAQQALEERRPIDLDPER